MSSAQQPLRLVDDRAIVPVAKRPWLKFFPSDWRGDERLGMCSLAARGLLTGLICLMHHAEPYGYLLVNGAAPTDAELARLTRVGSAAEVRRAREELLARGVLSVTADGILYSKTLLGRAAAAGVGRESAGLEAHRG